MAAPLSKKTVVNFRAESPWADGHRPWQIIAVGPRANNEGTEPWTNI